MEDLGLQTRSTLQPPGLAGEEGWLPHPPPPVAVARTLLGQHGCVYRQHSLYIPAAQAGEGRAQGQRALGLAWFRPTTDSLVPPRPRLLT